MTTLHVLGSGSQGNALALEDETGVLLIDAGFSARELQRRAGLVGLPLDRVVGLVLTHEHGDHTCGAARLSRLLDAPILTSPGTWDRLRPRMPTAPWVPLALLRETVHGGFAITACATSHDAAEPVAVAVRTPTGHRISVAYDVGRVTTGLRFLLRQSHAIVLEANHDEVLLRTSDYPPVVQERIASSTGHLSNRAAAELLAEVAHEELEAVVLAHLSARSNTADAARDAVAPVLRRACPQGVLLVARQDAPLDPIGLTPVPGPLL